MAKKNNAYIFRGKQATTTNPDGTKTTTTRMNNNNTKAVNNGISWLNQVDPNTGGLYGNAASILTDNGAVQAYENARQNGIQMANRQYNDNARNYYQMYKQNQNKLAENLSRLGINGGASETAALNQLNQYSGNIYNNSQAKANALNDINMQYDQLIAQNSAEIASQLANMYYNLGNTVLSERRQWDRDDYVRQQGYAREDALNAYDRALAQAQYTGDFSSMKQFGWSSKDIKNANKIFANGSLGGSGGSSSGVGRSGGSGYRYYSYGSGSGSSGSDIDMSGYGEETPTNPKKKKNKKNNNNLSDTASEKAYLKKSRRTNGTSSTGSNATYNALYANLGSAKTVGELKAAWARVNNTSGGITEAQRNKLYQLYVARRKKVSNGPSKDTGGGKKDNAGGGSNKQQYK